MAPAGAAVTINEVKAKGTEFIELYNSGTTVDVTGWQLCDNAGTVLCETLTGVIAGGGFMNVVTTLGLSNDGGIELRTPPGSRSTGSGTAARARRSASTFSRSPMAMTPTTTPATSSTWTTRSTRRVRRLAAPTARARPAWA
jgi:hypothetical protein